MECKCIYGVGDAFPEEEWDASWALYFTPVKKSGTTVVVFNFCPICGRKLEFEEVDDAM